MTQMVKVAGLMMTGMAVLMAEAAGVDTRWATREVRAATAEAAERRGSRIITKSNSKNLILVPAFFRRFCQVTQGSTQGRSVSAINGAEAPLGRNSHLACAWPSAPTIAKCSTIPRGRWDHHGTHAADGVVTDPFHVGGFARPLWGRGRRGRRRA